MSTLIIFYADSNSAHIFDKAFDGKSAIERSLSFGKSVPDSKTIVFACENQKDLLEKELKSDFSDVFLLYKSSWSLKSLLYTAWEYASENKFDDVVFSFADLPFLNLKLTDEILNQHKKYKAEYSFADGYPYGFSPEVLATDTLKILSSLAESNPQFCLENKISRDGIFSLLKTEINSFEIETIIAPEDFRMYRLSFDCGSKSGILACTELFNMNLKSDDPVEIASEAVKNIQILKTVPGYYNVQISGKCTGKCLICPYAKKGFVSEKEMKLEDFKALCKQISELSENAVVSLSSWGEALNHSCFSDFVSEVLKYKGISVLVETDGLNITEEIAEKIKNIADMSEERTNGQQNIMWIVALDAFSSKKYEELRGGSEADFEKAKEAVLILEKYFPGKVYPQMVRVNQNEEELEAFYRFWNEKTSPSSGALIVQKYDNFCGTQEDLRPADIAPLDRNVCWHLLRDVNILVDGKVTVCHEFFDDEKENVLGNVFTDGLEKIWQKQTEFASEQLNNNYCEKCEKCDEYYTFNF